MDVGIWASADMDDTSNMTKHMFGKYLSHLLFVTYANRQQEPIPDEFKDEEGVK